jgi:hypothetical protein
MGREMQQDKGASMKTPASEATEAEGETRLQEALAKMKAATDRHAAVVAVMSRLRVSPAERRLAQSESRKVDRELQDARRSLREAESAARQAKARSVR